VELKLPMSVVDRHDIAQLAREVQSIDEFMLQTQLRKPGETMSQLPRLSRMLEEVTDLNNLNLLNDPDRDRLKQALEWLKDHAPIVHMSFAVDPPAVVITRLLEWFRVNVHPFTLIKFGLQPTIAAGCSMRTYSKYYDLSLRKSLKNKNYMLINLIKGLPPEGAGAPDKTIVITNSVPSADIPLPEPVPVPSNPFSQAQSGVKPAMEATVQQDATPAVPAAAGGVVAAPTLSPAAADQAVPAQPEKGGRYEW
jgi:hypothetical protein